MIETATNTLVATVLVGGANGVAVTPDGKRACVTDSGILPFNGTVSVIDTATNTEVATVEVGKSPFGVAITPDGKHAYVANIGSNTVSVIATATNKVVATVPVEGNPIGVGIVPPPPGVPFRAFSATTLDITFGRTPHQDVFNLQSNFTLSSTASINPVTEAVKLQVGTFAATIPPGSFTKQLDGSFTFAGFFLGATVRALIKPAGTLRYAFHAEAQRASLTGTKNTVYVTLIIGGDSGATSVTAAICR